MRTLRFIASFILVLVVCTGAAFAGGQSQAAQADEVGGTIVVGGWPAADTAFEAILPGFNALYPNVQVDIEMQATADHHDRLITALAARAGAPDVAMVEAAYIGQFRDRAGFVNLLSAPYNAGRYEQDFVDYKWQPALSLDGERMIGLSWDIGPLSLFYRRDVFEEAGLPSDPDQVQRLMDSWDGYVEATRAVHIPGQRWLVGNGVDVFSSRWANRDYYNEDLSPRFNTEESLEVLEVASTLRREGLDANVGMWGPEWTSLLGSGQIVSVMAGSWFGGFIKDWIAPDTAGQWGVVRPPMEDVTNWGGSYLVIPDQSSNKVTAWAFIEYSLATRDAQNGMFRAVDYFPSYTPSWDDPIYSEPDPFFGGQQTRQLWISIARDTEPTFVTIMDSETEEILSTVISSGLDQGLTPRQMMDQAMRDIESATAADREEMARLLGR